MYNFASSPKLAQFSGKLSN